MKLDGLRQVSADLKTEKNGGHVTGKKDNPATHASPAWPKGTVPLK